jgi:hypothetical protein
MVSIGYFDGKRFIYTDMERKARAERGDRVIALQHVCSEKCTYETCSNERARIQAEEREKEKKSVK